MAPNPNPTMRPVTFDSCHGWLHLPAGGAATAGVVLCSPFGYDALCVHRGWRDFATALTAFGGMPTLRFDYPGTGDSNGNEDDPQRFRAWIDSVKAAAAYLRATTGVTRLILCGLRLGATLAALAAEELDGVDGLVLMMPVIAGKRYIRELGMQHQSWVKSSLGSESAESHHAEGAVGAFGFHLYADSLEQLGTVDLARHAQACAPRVLLHDLCDSAPMSRLVERYQSHGTQADVQIFPEYDKFLVDPRLSAPPWKAFDSVLAWLGFQADTIATPAVKIVAPRADARIEFAGGHETAVVMGGGRYAGVFCQPRCPLKSAPAVLLVNTGGTHRVGAARMAVLMARRLAAQGIASLRMDLGGIGDSLHHDNAPTLDTVYTRHSVTDATAGVEWLTAAGHRDVVMFGVCAGAYASIHTALAHPRVVGFMSVNLPFFFWNTPQTKPATLNFGSNRMYWRAIRSPRKWFSLLTGGTDGFAKVMEVARRCNARLTSRVMSPFVGRLGVNTSNGKIRRFIADLERKGVQTALVYGALDTGRDELETHFGPSGRQLDKRKNVSVDIFTQLDHALFSHTARNIVMTQFEKFIRERFRGADAPVAAPVAWTEPNGYSR